MKNIRVGNTREIRELDRIAIEEYRIPGIILMENAGRGAAEAALRMIDNARCCALIVCGPGNNGGDGFVIGRHLHNNGINVEIILVNSDRIKPGGDAAVNREIVRRMGLPLRDIRGSDTYAQIEDGKYSLLIDALLGTGLSGEVREPARGWIRAMNESGLPILAVDTPSGLDTDSGDILGVCVHAARTVTFAAAKRGFFINRGPEVVGELEVVDIGAPREALENMPLAGSVDL